MDWAALWDWIGKIEPGSWSEWVASILTAGSLLLGFSILRRDRVKEVRAQALRILVWVEEAPPPTPPGGQATDYSYETIVHVRNTSDRQIFRPALLVRPRKWRRVFERCGTRLPMRSTFQWLHAYAEYNEVSLEPGTEWSYTLKLIPMEFARHCCFVIFQDGAGVFHMRRVRISGPPQFYGPLTRRRELSKTNLELSLSEEQFHGLGFARTALYKEFQVVLDDKYTPIEVSSSGKDLMQDPRFTRRQRRATR